MGTDRDWERWGANDPYFGVISNEAYRSGAMSADSRAQFFASGKAHVAGTLAALRDLFGVEVAPCSVLDFGCGVGRLVIPFARASGHVTGMDISPSMLAETRANCAAEGLSNVSLLQSTGDRLPELHASYDLIHSDIVLPHIAWARGRTIIGALARHVTPGGFLALQMLTACTAPRATRVLVKLRYVFPPANWLRNLMRSRPMLEPAMQLHVYDLDTVKADLAALGFVVKQIDTDLPDFRSTVLYAQRAASQRG